MIAQLRSEWVKTTSTRACWVIGLVLLLVSPAAAVVLTLGIQAAPAARLDLGDADDVGVLYNLPASIVYVLPLILGVLLVTGEYQSRTISQTLLGEPRRLVVFAAKLAVGFAFSAALAFAAMATTTAAVAGVLVVGGAEPLLTEGPVASRIGGAVLALTLWGLIGVGIGALLRNQLVAVVLVLAFTQLIEPMIRVVAGSFGLSGVVAYLPGAASDSASGGSLISAATGSSPMTQPTGVAVLAGYVVVVAILGAARFRRPNGVT